MLKNKVSAAIWSLLLVSGPFFLTSCSGDSGEATTEHHSSATTPEEDIEVIYAAYDSPETFQTNFREATEHYLALKDALVASKPEEAQQHARAMSGSLNAVDASTLESDAAEKWKSVEKELKSGAAAIAGTSDLATQRGAFTAFSENMITATEAFGAGSTVYKQYCPMANKNKGGSWLSSKTEIRNPYYGDAMLTCGEVQAAIQNKQD